MKNNNKNIILGLLVIILISMIYVECGQTNMRLKNSKDDNGTGNLNYDYDNKKIINVEERDGEVEEYARSSESSRSNSICSQSEEDSVIEPTTIIEEEVERSTNTETGTSKHVRRKTGVLKRAGRAALRALSPKSSNKKAEPTQPKKSNQI